MDFRGFGDALILRPLASRAHFHDARVEAGEGFDEVALGGHYGFDVLVARGHFVETRRNECHVAFLQEGIGGFPVLCFGAEKQRQRRIPVQPYYV